MILLINNEKRIVKALFKGDKSKNASQKWLWEENEVQKIDNFVSTE
jgi:hypothetical protein